MPRRWAQLALIAATLTGLLAAQAPRATPGKIVTFSANTRLVVEAVSVTDTGGEPIPGLTAKDFQITEDGKPQTIAFSEYQRLSRQPLAPAPANAAPPQPPPPSPTGVQIAPETAGHSYRGRRLLVLYFDMTSMPPSDQLRALDAAGGFVSTGLDRGDLVAIMQYTGKGVEVEQDFTANREALQTALGKILEGTGMGLSDSNSDAASADTGSAFGQDDSEFNIFNTNRQLAALRTAVDMLSRLTEKKSLVYFASGIQMQGVDNQAQLEAATNAAVKANVALYPIDARGLTASAPLGNASQGSPGGVAMYNGQAAAALNMRRIRSQDTLYALGADTGGKAILDTNNLAGGINRARDAIGSYYILGYYTTNAALDGKYRNVRISLTTPRPHIKLDYRKGYYAGKVFAKFTTADKERQLEDALMLGNPITDLTLALEVNAFQLNSAEYFVPVAAKIPGSELALAKKGGAGQAEFDFIGEVKDAYGSTMTNMRDQVKVKLTGASLAALNRTDIEFNTGFTLLPGDYTLKLLARDDETGKIGTYIKNFNIPNLERQKAGLAISSVVLSNQTLALAQAAFNAKHNAAAEAVNPLVTAGQQLMPSVTRAFRRGGQMYVFLQAYEHETGNAGAAGTHTPAAAAAAGPIEAFASFFPAGGGPAAWQTPLYATPAAPAGKLGMVPVRLAFRLSHLKPGRYVCQVTVLEPGRQRAAFWRAPVLILP